MQKYCNYIVIIYIIDYLRFIKTSTSVTLFAAIVGPSAPAFLAIYLSRYSEQASVSRKQEFLLNITIRKEISEARRKHYEELSGKLERLKTFLIPLKARTTFTYQNPLLLDELEIGKIRDLIDDASIKNHMEGFHNNEHTFSIQKLVSFLEDVDKVIHDVKQFEEDILSETKSLLEQYSSITLDKTAKNINDKTCIGTDSLIIVLFNIWEELYNSRDITEQKFIDEHFPKMPGQNNLKNETIWDWYIGTPNLIFRNELILTYTDSLSANYDVLDIVRKLTFNISLNARFKDLYDRVRGINEYIWKAEKIIDEIKEKISTRCYKQVYNCCPYPEIDLSDS